MLEDKAVNRHIDIESSNLSKKPKGEGKDKKDTKSGCDSEVKTKFKKEDA